MKRLLFSVILCCAALAAGARKAASPNGKLTVRACGGQLVVCHEKKQVLALAEAPGGELRFVGKVKDDYRMLTGKRLHCMNEANEYEASIGPDARMTVRLYNDGIAFRYEYLNLHGQKHPEEHTAYIIPEGKRRWMQQWSDGYEGFFPMTTTAEVKTLTGFGGSVTGSDINTHWGYPLLVEASKGVFALITEANIERRQSASSLWNEGEVFRVKQDRNDLLLSGEWHTPWRVVIVGGLADIVQSTLVTDVSEPSRQDDVGWIKPGVVSWVYWAYNHGSSDFNIIRKYIDMAAALHLPYVLIDAEWDEMDKVASNEGKTIEDAVTYALSRNVKPLIWYNSSIGWIDGAPGPKFRLNKPEDREKEFAWCEKIGVAGVKIDFFSGDNQMNMDYCQDLLECAARHHLLVNFHGAPVPRGWQRTYPNLLSTEGVYGAEWYNNVPHFTEKAARHNATLPFTRNVVGPMDYTPCAFSDSQHPHITSKAHELALTVLFESGLQHLADRPESFLSQPQEVQAFLGELPTVWDETRFVGGYPGESAVLARRSGSTWYVAGINGKDEPQTLATNLRFIGKGRIQMFADDASGNWQISNPSKLPSKIDCVSRGGFVLVVKGEDCGPVPTKNQLRWQNMEMYAFIHYSLNTYTDQEWGYGNEDPKLFNPSDLDCRQWARVCKQAGMKGIIFTAKHHCGFCMWPSKYTEYSVKNSPWKDGKGDVVRELAEACKKEGLDFAVYLSPWDRNHPEYGRPEYVTYFRNQLRELLTEYGDMFEVWFDGANGGDGWYGGANERRHIEKDYYGWPETFRMIRELQPKALIWSDAGGDRGDLRWVGTEAGFIGETNWSLVPREGRLNYTLLHYGAEDGELWVPGETNTSIRPGWFYHKPEDAQVKSLSKLMDTYYKSVGRNSCLLLNFPVMPNGRIHPTDSLRGIAFKKMIDEVFRKDLVKEGKLKIEKGDVAKGGNGQGLTFNVQWDKPTAFNRFVVEEDIRYGQRVKKFSLEAEVDGRWMPLKDELVENGDGLTTIGHRRIICFPTVNATRLRLTVTDAKCKPVIKRISVYLAPPLTADIPNSGEKHSSSLHYFFSNPKQMMIDYEQEQTITAFRYLPPQTTREGIVTHYTLWASSDWQNWTKLSSGEFSNIANNPI